MFPIYGFELAVREPKYLCLEEVGDALLEYIIKVASGEEIPKAVQLKQNDFIPWKRGVSL